MQSAGINIKAHFYKINYKLSWHTFHWKLAQVSQKVYLQNKNFTFSIRHYLFTLRWATDNC